MLEGIIVFVILLGFLIIFHELGHFLVAKKIGILVQKFSIGFGPKLFSFRDKETEYVFAPILLGGYVKMAGEMPGEEKPGDEDNDEADVPEHRKFFNRTAAERIAIVAAGPLTNYITGILIFSLIFLIGIPTLTSRVGGVMEGTPAQLAGLQKGDLITAIDGEEVWRWQDMAAIIQKNAEQKITFAVERSGEKLFIDITPAKRIVETPLETVEVGQVGIEVSEDPEDYRIEYFNPLKAVWLGTKDALNITKSFFYGLTIFFQGKVDATDMVAGPIGIYKMGEKMASLGVRQFLWFVGFISINLAIINLLPIPILDGGQIVFFLIEMVRGKPLGIRTREMAQVVGLALLMSLMAFAIYSDLVRTY